MVKWLSPVTVVMSGENKFPNYKAGRKANRAKSEHDWEFIFDVLAKIKQEIKDFLPYKVIAVESAEADDIIATLCKRTNEKVLILSGDKDFIQLHNDRIKQYNPVLNKFVGKGEDPYKYIREHILKGDRSDGIPNILSDDNVFIENRRQTPLSKKEDRGMVKRSITYLYRRTRKELFKK